MADRLTCAAGHFHFRNQAWLHVNCVAVVVHTPMVVNAKPPAVVNRKRDRHKDKAARKVYHREVMRKRRAEGRT